MSDHVLRDAVPLDARGHPDRRFVVLDDPLEVLDGEVLDAVEGGGDAEGGREPPPAHHHGEDRVAVAGWEGARVEDGSEERSRLGGGGGHEEPEGLGGRHVAALQGCYSVMS